MNQHNITYIDATGLNCPMPLTMLKNAMSGLPVGAVIQISVTDIHAELDFETWCERFGHQIKKSEEKDQVLSYLVTKFS